MVLRYRVSDLIAKLGRVTLKPAKQSKYRNVKTVAGGVEFDSKREAKRYDELLALQSCGAIFRLERQVTFNLVPAKRRPDGTLERAVNYIADFTYTRDEVFVVEDVKSPASRTQAYVVKRKLMLERYGIAIHEVL